MIIMARKKRKKYMTKKQKKTIGRGIGTAIGVVAGAEAMKGTRYRGLGAVLGGYAGYKIGGELAGNPKPKPKKQNWTKKILPF
jgi:hypothetical protein